jgi:hypothetical protein
VRRAWEPISWPVPETLRLRIRTFCMLGWSSRSPTTRYGLSLPDKPSITWRPPAPAPKTMTGSALVEGRCQYSQTILQAPSHRL